MRVAKGQNKVGRTSMAKHKRSRRDIERAPPGSAAAASETGAEVPAEDQISSSPLSLHELFEQQARQMLDRSDLDEEQKQNILIAMSCPCCGAGAMSYTARLKR
jgi:hypothetical protein